LCGFRRVAAVDRVAQALGERLRRRAVAQVLDSLLCSEPNALLLLLDVWHIEKTPASAGGGDGSKGARPFKEAPVRHQGWTASPPPRHNLIPPPWAGVQPLTPT